MIRHWVSSCIDLQSGQNWEAINNNHETARSGPEYRIPMGNFLLFHLHALTRLIENSINDLSLFTRSFHSHRLQVCNSVPDIQVTQSCLGPPLYL